MQALTKYEKIKNLNYILTLNIVDNLKTLYLV